MKILDKYVAKNFMIGYLIAFAVLIGLRMMIDMFVNLDEFTEQSQLGFWGVSKNILSYYSIQSTIYFRDFAGMLTVVAASFSLGKMTRNNELVAVMTSGVSLKRVIAPIVFLALLLTSILIIDQEFFIPQLADRIVRSRDEVAEEVTYDMWFISDEKGSLFCSPQFRVKQEIMEKPVIITRIRKPESVNWKITGIIQADSARYNADNEQWDLTNGSFQSALRTSGSRLGQPAQVLSYPSSLKPRDIPVRRKSANMDLLSSYDLMRLARQSPKDLPRLYAQKNFRITDPIINLIMLMVCLPILVCRDPKAMKSAIMISFATTALCYITAFVCKMMASEVFFGRIVPQLWAWIPIFIFLPIAFIELDSMKT
ncbi:MAG: LptF/LptG family permease [Planctomycetes bacterium]|nr:LptF/LptG family permease [Planctomycetota bacterium]